MAAAGMTLVELLTTLGVLAVLATLAAPSFHALHLTAGVRPWSTVSAHACS